MAWKKRAVATRVKEGQVGEGRLRRLRYGKAE
jgi:hypothetical protein